MEISHDLSLEEAERSFSLRVDELSEPDRERYEKLLLKYKLDQAKPHGGRPAGPIPLEIREEIFLSAKVSKTDEDAAKALDMKLAFQKATSKRGRPPIAGAQDN